MSMATNPPATGHRGQPKRWVVCFAAPELRARPGADAEPACRGPRPSRSTARRRYIRSPAIRITISCRCQPLPPGAYKHAVLVKKIELDIGPVEDEAGGLLQIGMGSMADRTG